MSARHSHPGPARIVFGLLRASRHARAACVWASMGIALASPGALRGQVGGGVGSGDRIEGRAKLLPIPYLGYNRSLGWAFGAVPTVLFNPVSADKVSPSSIAGGFGMYTTNKTWGAGGFTVLFLDEDRWRVTAAGGTGTVKFQFFLDQPVDAWIPYSTAADFALLSLERRVWRDAFLGLGYQYSGYETSTDSGEAPPAMGLHGLRVSGSLDRRSGVRYPRDGSVSNAKLMTYPEWLGNESGSSVVTLDHVHYKSLRGGRDVLAGRAFAGMGIGEVSFNQQFIVGGKDIRGYSKGKYRGDDLIAIQAEYRWNVRPRIGFVGFAGAAWLFEAVNEEDEGRALPGAGAGFRFTADTETHLNVGLDIAFGRDDWSLSFRFGEAF